MSDYEEFDMEFSEETIQIMDQLISEGKFEDRSDFVQFAIETRDMEPAEAVSADPGLDQRIRELRLIQTETSEEVIYDFFADTSYLMQRYSRKAHDKNLDQALDRIDIYMGRFNNMLVADEPDAEDVGSFLDETVELTDDYHNATDDRSEKEFIEAYVEAYFDHKDMEELLVG